MKQENKNTQYKVSFSTSEIREILNYNGNSLYNVLKDIAFELDGKGKMGYSDPEKNEFIYMTIIPTCKFKNGSDGFSTVKSR